MNLLLVVCGAALVALPGVAAPRAARLDPRQWAPLAASSLRIGLVAARLGLLISAVPAALHAVGVHGVEELCHQGFGASRLNSVVSLGSGGALIALQARMTWARRQSRATRASLRVESWLGQHHRRGDHDLVVIPARAPIAYALEGRPSQIVVSQRLVSVLTDAELEAVLSHERCHLRHRHQGYLDLAVGADAGLAPLQFVRRSTATLRLAIERWADEAAVSCSSRRTVRRALTKVVDSMAAPVPAFTAADTIAARLDALDTEPAATPTRRCCLATATSAAMLVALVGAAALAVSAPFHHGVMDLLQCCLL